MTSNPFTPSLPELPERLAVFPLPGALLLPHQQLPLNIFEPRYLRLVLDALGEGRTIGMIQPDPARGPGDPPPIYDVGCAGRITAFQETDDGRLLISLTGVCRFHVLEEIEMVGGYRRVRADWSRFVGDLEEATASVNLASDVLESTLRGYLDANGLQADWAELRKVEVPTLVALLSMKLPLSTEEKQALLEADSGHDRARLLMASLASAAGGDAPERGALH